MTWDAHHRRGEVLRAVVDEANARRDGVLPLEVPGVAETFGDELSLVGALQLRWHTRLAGRIERALADQPVDLEYAVLSAWRATARELVGVREVLDTLAEHPSAATPDNASEIARALDVSRRKDWALMAAMAGRAGALDESAARIGRGLEQQARAAYNPTLTPRHRGIAPVAGTVAAPAAATGRRPSLLGRLKAHLAA
jgi:hypothetical protein